MKVGQVWCAKVLNLLITGKKMSRSEIARKLGVKTNTDQKRLSRALEKLVKAKLVKQEGVYYWLDPKIRSLRNIETIIFKAIEELGVENEITHVLLAVLFLVRGEVEKYEIKLSDLL